MSAYGDYKAGLITSSEYTRICKEEARRDEYFESIREDDDEEVTEDDFDELELF